MMALQWAANLAENEGDIDAARGPTPSARWPPPTSDTTPWQRAMLHTQMALLAMQVGDPRRPPEHAEVAWPLLDAPARPRRRGAGAGRDGDGVAACSATSAECERVLDEIARHAAGPVVRRADGRVRAPAPSSPWPRATSQAGLAAYLEAVDRDGARIRFPGMETSGLEPWTMVAEVGRADAPTCGTPRRPRSRPTGTGWPRSSSTRARGCSRDARRVPRLPGDRDDAGRASGAWVLDTRTGRPGASAYACW